MRHAIEHRRTRGACSTSPRTERAERRADAHKWDEPPVDSYHRRIVFVPLTSAEPDPTGGPSDALILTLLILPGLLLFVGAILGIVLLLR